MAEFDEEMAMVKTATTSATKRVTKAAPKKAAAKKTLEFDFATLEDAIVAASRKAFADVRRAHGHERLCAFALYSDDGAMTVCPAFDLTSALEARQAADPDDPYMKFATPEWKLEGFGADAAFNRICTRARTFVMAIEANDASFVAFKRTLFETCLRALERLRDGGVFAAYPDLLVMFAVSDDGDPDVPRELRMMKRLNGTSPHVAEHRRWTKTWGS